jgi:hypothetical protein
MIVVITLSLVNFALSVVLMRNVRLNLIRDSVEVGGYGLYLMIIRMVKCQYSVLVGT